jgi:pyruvate,water dikinase
MSLFDGIKRLFGSSSAPAVVDEAAEALRLQMQARCLHFRRLLAANKAALEIMADIEERMTPKAKGGYRPFDMTYVRSAAARSVAAVFQMINNLNALSDRAYDDLKPAFSRIARNIDKHLGYVPPSHEGPLVLPLSEIRASDVSLVGGKMAQLGEVANRVNLPVPDGFAVTAAAYNLFMAVNNLQESIDLRIQQTDSSDLKSLIELSHTIQQRIYMAVVPQELMRAFDEALEPLRVRYGKDLRLALRSSAVDEDVKDASFAGQFATELSIEADDAMDVWREIIASKYSVAAMSYRFTRGILDDSVPMCVGVLVMVDALAGGVAYSQNPAPAPDVAGGQPHIVINAVQGLPKPVVDGSFSPDVFRCSRAFPPVLLDAQRGDQAWRLRNDPEHGLVRVDLSQEERQQAALSPEQACAVARMALMLEEYYGTAQDVEWALTADGGMVLLQSRALKTAQAAPEGADNAEQEEAKRHVRVDLPLVAQGGVVASAGVGLGTVFVARRERDILSFPRGGVLVVEQAHPYWATLLPRAAALVCEAGGTAGHLASVAREYGLPALFGIAHATTLLADKEVTVDTQARAIYEGLYEDIVPPAPAHNPMASSPVYAALESIVPFIVPLNLLDPESEQFAPAYCETLHDITRFCHEKAVSLLFDQEDSTSSKTYGKQLKVGKKLQYWIMDMEGGFKKPVSGSVVELDNIQCQPLLALWEGMTAVPWEGPPSLDASGFMSVVMESTMKPQLETMAENAMQQKNFFIIDRNYVNLQARFGYHFCTVDANVTENPHENYVSFQFKGGAASAERRITRAHMVARVLEAQGFRCDVKSDALFAIAEGRDQHGSLRRVAVLGHLLLHTRQIDMVMNRPGMVQRIEEKLLAETTMIMERDDT